MARQVRAQQGKEAFVDAPFEPADGERARWRYCYDLVESAQPGDEITYMMVAELLDCDREQALAAMREAKRHLEHDRKRTVRNVPKYGWIVLDAAGNLREADSRIKRARNATTRAADVVLATPRDELSQIERARMDFQAQQLQSARGLYERKSRSFSELEKASKTRQQSQLPLGKSDSA